MESIDYSVYFEEIISEISANTEIFEEMVLLLQLSNYLQVFIVGVLVALGVTIVIKGLI
jgi:hypothetical protein